MVDVTTFLSKLECKEISEMIKEEGNEDEQWIIEELTFDNNGMYIANFCREAQSIIGKYACYLDAHYSDAEWKKRMTMMNPKNFGEEGFITDSKIILIASFSQLKGLTLDGDSALSMIQLFRTELRDQYCFIEDDEDIEDAIDYFEEIVEYCDWTNEEGVLQSFENDIEDIDEELDNDERIEIMMDNLVKEGYYDLHKIDVDNYLIFNH